MTLPFEDRKQGSRLCFWLPKNKEWIIKKIRQMQKECEEEGIKATQGFIITRLLEKALSGKKTPFEGFLE